MAAKRTTKSTKATKAESKPAAAVTRKRAAASTQRRRRRITAKYRPYLEQIAAMWVSQGHNAAHTAKLVNERLHLPSFTEGFLKRWMGVPEFATLVRIEEERQAVDSVTSPFVRGPQKIKWLGEVERCMRETYESPDTTDAPKAMLLSAIHKLAGELRAEQAFLETMKERRARQSLANFVRNLLRFGKEIGAPVSVWQFFERALGRLDRLIGGGTELVDADVIVRMLYERLGRAPDDEAGTAREDLRRLSDEQLEALARRQTG